MSNQAGNLYEYDNLEVLRIIWDIFANFARTPDALKSSTYFTLEGEGGVQRSAFENCKAEGLIDKNKHVNHCDPFLHVVRKVFQSAINMGLILPNSVTGSLDWNNQSGAFHFTAEGLKYFSDGFISVDDPGYLGKVLEDMKQRIPTISDGEIALLLEAQRCLKAGCYRAGMVVIGLANENVCLNLLDAILQHCPAPSSGSSYTQDWVSASNQSLAFSARWKPGIRILVGLKSQLRSLGKGESWFQWWEMIPGTLYTIGEAVRLSRNVAAHVTDREFSKAEVALLLGSMPTQLEMLNSIIDFLSNSPISLASIQL